MVLRTRGENRSPKQQCSDVGLDAAVRLTPDERGEVAVTNLEGIRSDHSLVPIEARMAEQPHTEEERDGRHARTTTKSPYRSAG